MTTQHSGTVVPTQDEPSGRRRSSWRAVAALRAQWAGDQMLRNSVGLMANMITLSALAFVFWMVAGRMVPAAAVGTVTTTMSSVTLLSTASALGLPVALVPYLNRHRERTRSIMMGCLAAAGTAAVLVGTVALFTPLRPPYAGQSGPAAALIVAVVVTTTFGSVQDAAFVAARKAHLMLVKNTIAGVVRIVLLVAWQPWDWPADQAVHRLMLIQAVGVLLPALIALWQQRRVLSGPVRGGGRELAGLRGYAMHNYGATLVSMLPMTVTPLLVISMLGSEQAAYFAMPLMLLGLLNVIPNSVGQSLLAENADTIDRLATLRRALRTAYAAIVPGALAVIALAYPALLIFGRDYAENATGLLRLFAVGAVFSVISYLANAAVNAAGDGRGFLLLTICNSAIVLGLVWQLGGGGLTQVGLAWALAQALAGVVATTYLALNRRRILGRTDSRAAVGAPAAEPTAELRTVSYPRDPNPYQGLLHAALAQAGVRAGYLPEPTGSAGVNLALLPLLLLLARLRGTRVWHLHWVFAFAPAWVPRVPGARSLAYCWFRIQLRWARLIGLRIVWTAHNHLPHSQVFPDDRRARRVLCRRADLVIAHSDDAARALVRDFGLSEDKVLVIAHGPFDLRGQAERPREQVRAELGVADRGVLLGLLGRIDEYKGAEDLLRAVAECDRRGVWPGDSRVLIAGRCDEGLRPRLEALAQDLPQVTLLPRELTDAEYAELLDALDLAVLPFSRITTSGSALAALSMGVPVALPEGLLRDLPNSAVLRFTQLTAFLSGISDMPHEELRQIGRRGAEWVAEWSWSDVAQATDRAYRLTLSDGNRGGGRHG